MCSGIIFCYWNFGLAKKLQLNFFQTMYEILKTRYNAFSKTENDVFSGKILQCEMLILQGFLRFQGHSKRPEA